MDVWLGGSCFVRSQQLFSFLMLVAGHRTLMSMPYDHVVARDQHSNRTVEIVVPSAKILIEGSGCPHACEASINQPKHANQYLSTMSTMVDVYSYVHTNTKGAN